MFRPPTKDQKISYYIIEQIRDAIFSGKFKPGDRLASEKELVEQFQVSKASMREALRVLEAMGLIAIRKGLGGGIFVAEVDMRTAVHGLMNFLHFKNVSIRDITQLRYFLEPPLAELAAAKSDSGDILRLQRMTEQELLDPYQKDTRGLGFHLYIARLSENPLTILLMDFVEGLLADIKNRLKPEADFFRQVGRAHYRLLDCFTRKDAAAARQVMADHVLEVGNHLAGLEGSAPFEALQTATGADRAVPTSPSKGAPPWLPADLLQAAHGDADRAGELLPLQHLGTGEVYLVRLQSPDGSSRGEDRRPPGPPAERPCSQGNCSEHSTPEEHNEP